MDTVFDASLKCNFWNRLEEAFEKAMSEAANTGGVVLTAKSIELRTGVVLFVGTMPAAVADLPEDRGLGRVRVKCGGLGGFHTTWRAVSKPEETVGYLVLHHPLTLTRAPSICEEDTIWIAVDVPRALNSLTAGPIGLVCCSLCNRPLPEKRLKAIPGVRTCTSCKIS